MPQLNPSPWFEILVFSWLIIITFIPTKVLDFLTPNKPAPSEMKHKSNPWNWPW
uniref:ATP synthase complex subunit 8 n=1 Tax=Cyprinella lutrensis TaxID=28791 RepID=A0SDP6_CYPLU|nr:ATP synthase F0 subunit 8 [Cyprinella lutrensis]ABC72178.1 ATPase subunit 8 [Cyprinella lutrensis]WIW76401.1 ATP synthase F0 subunit 8 [Cyprinella lutrensis]BAF41328.1 ATPase subunit 8 [Cyprinella lutrensis]